MYRVLSTNPQDLQQQATHQQWRCRWATKWPTDASNTYSTIKLAILPPAARAAHICPELKNGALISVGQLCDHGCTAFFTKTDVTIELNGSKIMHGTRMPHNGMWMVNLSNTAIRPPPQTHVPNVTHTCANIHTISTKRNLVTYFHKCCFSPTVSAWIAATDAGFFISWPGLTT
jgi:hypothetical protein